MKKINLSKLFCHILFILGLIWCFGHYSFLRPISLGALYKEYITAFILLTMLYTNYLLFIPKFYLKQYFKVFLMFSLISVIFPPALEMILVTPNIITCLPSSFTEYDIRNSIIMHSFLVGSRDLAFLLFFFVLKIFENEKQTLERERNALMELKGEICVPNGKDDMKIINVSEILYISHERNYTYIYTTDGCRYCQYISLSKMEDLLPKDLFCRINRNVIIPTIRIVKLVETSVTIFGGYPACEHSFNISKNYALDMKNRINESGGLNHLYGGLNSQNGGLKDHFGGLNESIDMANLEEFMDNIAHDEDLLNLCRIIAKDPSVTTKSLSEQLHIPLRTIERKIKYLKDNGVLQHNGAKKNGGYAFSPSVSPTVLNWLTGEHNN